MEPCCNGVIGLDVSRAVDVPIALAGEGYVRRVTRFAGSGAVLEENVAVLIC